MALQYTDRDVGHLLGAWFVLVGLLAVSTARPSYSPILAAGVDSALFIGLLALVVGGAASSRYCDLVLGVPMSVCGGLVVWSTCRRLLDGAVPVTERSLLLAAGLVVLGSLFVREGVLIARGRRHCG
ncbi:hypothetical protein [Halohasta salina]|uniref:hypothetical protein n=1 Tax=Halohasta salina TaxID=2961621 RepID=UPI0020A44ADC|nr:hypothetical protein [Halohasta salina]